MQTLNFNDLERVYYLIKLKNIDEEKKELVKKDLEFTSVELKVELLKTIKKIKNNKNILEKILKILKQKNIIENINNIEIILENLKKFDILKYEIIHERRNFMLLRLGFLKLYFDILDFVPGLKLFGSAEKRIRKEMEKQIKKVYTNDFEIEKC